MLAFIGIKDLVTICNAFAGFAAIVVAAKGGNLPLACGLIFLAAVFDFLDGALARATAPNPFGKELDSLCDAVSFGLAPAALVFFQGPTAPLYYLAAPLIYLAGAIFRLARFNVTTQKNFTGIPSPVAALTATALTLGGLSWQMLHGTLIVLSFLMVCDIEYRSQKSFSSRQILLIAILGVSVYLAIGSLGGNVLGTAGSAVGVGYILSPLVLGGKKPDSEEEGNDTDDD
ncbi:MAG: CDP-diacylglycerol--serine O-phosphatidyltransferase [Candidatus Undinarchaeales archaeon]|nr:CDP-diacylglycerol--serine O-phosphatidyltransferase [Candidatus Undinarchaeales archaeon]MDP7493853.1 CDP-diacylglycerol--serine O-phosphatidyltransferase [Candidatus Undinarchaeales archaeon]